MPKLRGECNSSQQRQGVTAIANVLAFSCPHCPGMKEGFDDFLSDVADETEADVILCLGDAFSWDTISFHEKSPDLFSATEELLRARAQWKGLTRKLKQSRKRRAKKKQRRFKLIIGNHDALPLRKAAAAGLPSSVVRAYSDIFETQDWQIHPRFSRIRVDGVDYSHGEAGLGGQFAAVKQSRQNFRSTAIGHLHAEFGVWFTCNAEFRVFGMNVGCGMDRDLLQFEYGVKFHRKPALGCGTVEDGKRPVVHPWELPTR